MKQKIDLDLVSRLEAREKRFFIRDTEIEGLVLRVYPSGKLAWYLDYYSPCGDNRGDRVQYKVAGSELSKFQGKGALPKQLQQSAITGFRRDAKAARGLVDAGQDPSQQRRKDRQERIERKQDRLKTREEKRRLEEAARIEASNTLTKLLDEDTGLYTKKLKNNKSGTATRKMLLQAWADMKDVPLTKWTRQRIEAINNERLRDPEADDDDDDAGGVASSSLDRYCTAGKAFFNWAIEQGLCTENPFKGIPKYSGAYDYNDDFRYLTAEEAKRLVRQLTILTTPDSKGNTEIPAYMRPLTLLALHTGCRRGELFQLKWSDINGRVMTIQRANTKSNKTREVRLNETARQALDEWKRHDGPIEATGLVFPNRDGGKLSDIKNHWKALKTAAGIEDVKWHDLRHSFAANLAMADVSIHKISQLLGHSDLKMTMRYAKLAPDHLNEIDLLDEVFG